MFYDPFPFPWLWLILAALSVGAVVMVLGLLLRPTALGARQSIRFGVVSLSLAAFLLLALAAMDPAWIRDPSLNSPYLAVVLDVSDSILLAEEGQFPLRRQSQRLRNHIAAAAPQLRSTARAGLISFRGRAAVAKANLPLERLPAALANLGADDYAGGTGSNPALGLERAGQLIASAGGSGAVVLISDGNQTDGDSLKAAQRLAAKGIPIHILPLEGLTPGLALTAVDLPANVRSGVPTFLRGALYNGYPRGLQTQFSAAINAAANEAGAVTTALDLPADSFHRLRTPVTFKGIGLQFLDLSFQANPGDPPLMRRFVTHVNRPPRFLSVGGDHRWTGAFDREQAEIVKAEGLEGVDFSDLDVVVLGAVSADQFSDSEMQRLHKAVTRDGLGLMFINGDHQGRESDQPNVLMSYLGTPLEPLLAVSPEPRPFDEDPPPRQVVLLIDASGSMGGWRLRAGKEIAAHIIQNLLRYKDSLDLLAFSTGVDHLVVDRVMDAAGVNFALSQLGSIQPGGGTNPEDALELIKNRHMSHCGLIFISDGGFAPVTVRPECRSTVFAVGWNEVPASSPLWTFSDPIPVPVGFSPAGITLPYFTPEPRDKFYEDSRFTPLRVGQFLSIGMRVDIPDQPLPGNAVTYALSESVLTAVRPKLTDPVLAYRNVGMGRSAVFTSALTEEWLNNETARNAAAGWINRLIPYGARDRYHFQVRDGGDRLEMTVSVTAKTGDPPQVSQLTAAIADGQAIQRGLLMTADPLAPAVFHGVIPLTDRPQKVALVLTESGPDALDRPQRIPLNLPAAEPVSPGLRAERHSWGENRPLLRQLARLGGGLYDPALDQPLLRRPTPIADKLALRPALTLLASAFYLAAFVLRRWNP